MGPSAFQGRFYRLFYRPDGRRSRGGEYQPKSEIGRFVRGIRLPGRDVAFRIGRALLALGVERTCGLDSLVRSATDTGFWPNSERDEEDDLTPLAGGFLMLVAGVRSAMELITRESPPKALYALDEGYIAHVKNSGIVAHPVAGAFYTVISVIVAKASPEKAYYDYTPDH